MREILRTLASFESPAADATRHDRRVNADRHGTDHDSVCGRLAFGLQWQRRRFETPPFGHR
jgi:hypothetical protein